MELTEAREAALCAIAHDEADGLDLGALDALFLDGLVAYGRDDQPALTAAGRAEVDRLLQD